MSPYKQIDFRTVEASIKNRFHYVIQPLATIKDRWENTMENVYGFGGFVTYFFNEEVKRGKISMYHTPFETEVTMFIAPDATLKDLQSGIVFKELDTDTFLDFLGSVARDPILRNVEVLIYPFNK